MPPAPTVTPAPMVTDTPARVTMEDLLDAPKYFYTVKILQTTPHRDSIRDYLQDFLFVLAGSLDAGSQDDITEDLSYLSGLAADSELVFDVGIPEPLAFWVPAAPTWRRLTRDPGQDLNERPIRSGQGGARR